MVYFMIYKLNHNKNVTEHEIMEKFEIYFR